MLLSLPIPVIITSNHPSFCFALPGFTHVIKPFASRNTLLSTCVIVPDDRFKAIHEKENLTRRRLFPDSLLSSPPNSTPSGEAAAAGTAPAGQRHATLAEDNARRGLGSPNPP